MRIYYVQKARSNDTLWGVYDRLSGLVARRMNENAAIFLTKLEAVSEADYLEALVHVAEETGPENPQTVCLCGWDGSTEQGRGWKGRLRALHSEHVIAVLSATG